MRMRIIVSFFLLILLAGCTTTSTLTSTSPASPSSRSYNGTASVGDFLNITIDATAQTIAYTDLSNGDSGTVPYTVNSDGTYTLNDPKGNLLAAYEVPNYALMIEAAKTGPGFNTPALITAVESSRITMASFEGQTYNYMQFRTTSGGIDVGSVTVSAGGQGSNTSYWPYGELNGGNQGLSPFNSGSIDMTQASLDPSGTFLTVPDSTNGSTDYVFGTANGVFAVDTPNGAILALRNAASKDFDPSYAGTYKGIAYQKTGASMGMNNLESGTPSMSPGSLVVAPSGQVTVYDGQGNQVAQAMLIPVADATYLYNPDNSELQDPCWGIFTFRVVQGGVQQDVFIAFQGNATLFAAFGADLPWAPGEPYSYMYGAAIK